MKEKAGSVAQACNASSMWLTLLDAHPRDNLLFRLEVSVSNDYNVDPLKPVSTNQEAYYFTSRGLIHRSRKAVGLNLILAEYH